MEDQMNFRPSWLCPSAAQTSFRRILSLEGTSIASLARRDLIGSVRATSPDLPNQLDLVTDNFAKTQEYLAKMNAPRPPKLRAALLALPTAGCKAFSWNSQRLSLTCFKLPSGELLHVIVIAENAIPATHFDEHAREQDGWRIKYERSNGLLVIFFSRASMNEIIQFT
jgi:hypothetical protein